MRMGPMRSGTSSPLHRETLGGAVERQGRSRGREPSCARGGVGRRTHYS